MTIDVIRLAREANIDLEHHESIGREPVWIATQDELERFTAMVMEECAKVCDELAEINRRASTDSMWQQGECAAAIRARKPA